MSIHLHAQHYLFDLTWQGSLWFAHPSHDTICKQDQAIRTRLDRAQTGVGVFSADGQQGQSRAILCAEVRYAWFAVSIH